MDPAITSEPKEDWKPLENLVTLYCYDYQFHRPFPDESSQEGQRHNNEPGGDQIQAESKFRIAGTLNDAHRDWHLVRHTHHDNTHDDHKVISQDHGFVAEPVHGQQWGAAHKQNSCENQSNQNINDRQGAGIRPHPFQVSGSDTVANHNCRGRRQRNHYHFQILIESRRHGVSCNCIRGQMS